MARLRNWLCVILLASGCGGRYDIVVSGTVKISPSMDDMVAFFDQQCRRMHPNEPEQAISDCIRQETQNFLDFLTQLGKVS